VVQNDDNGIIVQSTFAGHVITVNPQIISQVIGVPVLQISASPFNEVVLVPSLDELLEFFHVAPWVRSDLLPSRLVLCLPRIAC